MKLTLTRRAILRGLGSAAVAIPTLELTGPSRTEAQASAPPKRFALFYAPQAPEVRRSRTSTCGKATSRSAHPRAEAKTANGCQLGSWRSVGG